MSGTENEGLDAVRERMRADGVRYVQVEVPELDGGLRCKLLALDKGLSDGIGWSNIIYGLTAADDVYESPFSSYENGFADVFGTPDAATACRLPWRQDTAAVLIDVHDPDGTMTPEGPRTMLRRAVDKADAMGFQPRFAVEYEVAVYYADDAASPPSPATLTPVSRTRNAYSVVRMPELRALFETFMQRMEEVGAPVLSMHTELGRGAVEFALAHAPPLAAADGAMRAKAYLKELCAERGMVVTFMAKVDPDMPGSGGARAPEPVAGRRERVLGGHGCERDGAAVRRRADRASAGAHRALHGQHQLVPAAGLAALGAAQRILGRRQPERGAPPHHPAGAERCALREPGAGRRFQRLSHHWRHAGRGPRRHRARARAAAALLGQRGARRELREAAGHAGRRGGRLRGLGLPARRLRRPFRRSLRALAPGRARSLARLAAEPRGAPGNTSAISRQFEASAAKRLFAPAFCHYIDGVGPARRAGAEGTKGDR